MSRFRRLVNTFRSGRLRRNIDREVAFHIEERASQLRAEGASEEEAVRRARLQFGGRVAHAEGARDVDVTAWLDASIRHTRIAGRTLLRTPMFTLTVVLTLALGIGANAAVFSALDAVLLRPLPFPDGNRLMLVSESREKAPETKISPVRLQDWNEHNTAFDGITGYFVEDVSESSGDLPERVARATVAPRFFAVWGVPPAIGRGFTDAEHRVGGPPAAVITDRYWRARLGADPRVLERTLRFQKSTIPIVGVMPASFLFPDRAVDIWIPVRVDADYAQNRQNSWFKGIGRLRAGVTLEQARGAMADVQRRLGEMYPATDAKIGVQIVPLRETIVGEFRASLWLLFAAVTVLLLITCTNVAALLLSRAAHREREIAIRLSLGATRLAVAMQVLVETIMLALAGAAVGLLVASGATAALRSMDAALPRIEEITVNRTILLYTFASALVAALLCGLLPAIRAARHGLGGTLSEGSRGQVSRRGTVQWILVGAQVALSVTLLTGAGLLLRSFQELWQVDPGFQPERVLTFRISGSWADAQDMGAMVRRFDRTLEELRALPGVESVAMSLNPPGSPSEREETFQLVEAGGNSELNIVTDARGVSPAYFATMRIPLVEGEGCRPQVPKTPRDLMVNEAFVARYMSGYPSPVGLHLSRGPKSKPFRIVGVVGNARERGLDHAPGPTIYWCADWNPIQYFLVRTSGDPVAITQAVRQKIKQLEPLRSVYDITPLTERIDAAFAENRLRTALLALFAVTALSLTCVGLFGTIGRRFATCCRCLIATRTYDPSTSKSCCPGRKAVSMRRSTRISSRRDA
jgi:putative ABC transport system permease protein